MDSTAFTRFQRTVHSPFDTPISNGAKLISAAGNGIAQIPKYQFELSIQRINQQRHFKENVILRWKHFRKKNERERQGDQPTEGLPKEAWTWGKKCSTDGTTGTDQIKHGS